MTSLQTPHVTSYRSSSDTQKVETSARLTGKLSLLGVNSLGVWFVSFTWTGGGGGEGLGAQAPTVTSDDLRPLSSSLRPKASSEEWLAS